MKRSQKISLVLLGGLSAGALSSCSRPATGEPRISSASVYPNDYYIAGAGYYHAPFHGFFPQRYNYYDPQLKLYYYGGQWGKEPFRSVVNISAPTDVAAQTAESSRLAIVRSGFGGSSGYHGVWS